MLTFVEKYAETFGFNRIHYSQSYTHYIKNSERNTIIIMTHEINSKYVTFFKNHKQQILKASDLIMSVVYGEHAHDE